MSIVDPGRESCFWTGVAKHLQHIVEPNKMLSHCLAKRLARHLPEVHGEPNPLVAEGAFVRARQDQRHS